MFLLFIQLFEGMKAFHGVDGKARLFRPMENMKRLNSSAVTMSLPVRDEVFCATTQSQRMVLTHAFSTVYHVAQSSCCIWQSLLKYYVHSASIAEAENLMWLIMYLCSNPHCMGAYILYVCKCFCH